MTDHLQPSRGYVLVVDDDLAICEMLREALSEAGCRVRCVATADEALREAEAETPGAALVDFVLKEARTSSVELAELLSGRGIKVLMMSGLLDAEDVLSRLPYRYLKKPFRLAALAAALRNIIPVADKSEMCDGSGDVEDRHGVAVPT